MTTLLSTTIDAAWKIKIFNHRNVLSITPKIYQYDISTESESDVDMLCYDGQVNFILSTTSRIKEPILGQQTQYTFRVEVQYYLQQTDIAENTYQDVRDAIEGIDDLVHSQLGTKWNSTVDYFTGGQVQPIRIVEISERKCWFGAIVYTAFKTS